MKVFLLTTEKELEENARIEEEARNIGLEYKTIDFREFEYKIVDSKLLVKDFEENPDVLIIRGVFRSIKPICAFVESLKRRGVKVFDNNFLLHKYSINKLADLIKLVSAGIPVPDSFHPHSFASYFEAVKILGYPIVCKLTRTGKGAGVYKFDNEEDFKKFIENLEKQSIEPERFLLQRYIPYKYDLRILVLGDKIFSMQRIPKEGEFRANFSLGGSVLSFDLNEEDKALALSAIKAVDVSIGGVDVLIGADGKRYVLEVNHTPGMIGMEKATGENITRVYLKYAIENAR